MAIHLVTTVDSDNWRTLEAMLSHYRNLQVEAFHVTLHLTEDDDSAREPVTEIMRRFGCPLYDVVTGDGESIEQETYARPRREYSRDWFILAGSDDLHQYPVQPEDLVRICESSDRECVYGGLVDRIAADGGIPELDPNRSLEEQFPLGATIADAVAQANVLKVVMVRGAIWVPQGQHFAPYANFCPLDTACVPVFRYKWHDPVMQTARKRRDLFRESGDPRGHEYERLLEHGELYGGFNIADPALRAAPCTPDYPYWAELREELKTRVVQTAASFGIRTQG